MLGARQSLERGTSRLRPRLVELISTENQEVEEGMTDLQFVDGLRADIVCPDCGDAKLIVRTNRLSGHQFLGCPRWPECEYTREIPEAWLMRAAGQADMFMGAGGG
jgi:ssDNA-binding Zn-finger/Zn-ribbon topoisomerase 1